MICMCVYVHMDVYMCLKVYIYILYILYIYVRVRDHGPDSCVRQCQVYFGETRYAMTDGLQACHLQGL